MKRLAKVRSELSVTDNGRKEEVYRDARTRELQTPNEVDVRRVAVVKVSNDIKLSMGYQSVGASVGIELPWPVEPTSDAKLKGELREAFDFAYQLIDDELASRAAEIDPLLKKLATKYGR